MTIASTGNKIADQLARASAANQRKEAAAKSKAAKAAKTGSRMGKIRAGRAAVKAGGVKGRGCVIKTHKAGKTAKGGLNYLMDKESTLVSSNCGTTKEEINRDMMRCAGMRNIKNPICHASFSLPAGETRTVEQWRQMIDVARAEIGLDDSFPYAAVLHDEEDHQNVHIIYSKVSDQGKIFDDYRLGLRFAALENVLEDRFNLKRVPVVRNSSHINLGKPEIEKAIRTNIQPERMQLNAIVTAAATGKQSVLEFISKCAAAGVVVRPNLATTGKLSGFSFSLADSNIEYAGSKIKCGWSDLQKMGVNYEQTTEFAALADHVAELESGTRTIEEPQPAPASVGAVGAPVEDQDRPTEPADRSTEAADRTAEGQPQNADRSTATQVRTAEVRVVEDKPASVDLVRRVLPVADRPGVAGLQPTIADDQVEPAAIEREIFEAIKTELLKTNASAEARAAAAVSMNWTQQREIAQIIKNIDAWHKRMNQVSAAPTAGDRPTSLPSM